MTRVRIAAILLLCLALVAPVIAQEAVSPDAPPASTTAPSFAGATYPPVPDHDGIYKPGNGVLPPRIVKRAPPQLSANNGRQRIDGVVAIGLVVDKNGDPQDVHVVRAMADVIDGERHAAAADMDRAALEAVRKYKFEPATLKGVVVPVRVTVEVRFFHTR